MNMQAIMKQAQAMQKEIAKIKKEIDESEFEGISQLVTVKVNGKKEVLNVTIAKDFDANDIDILEDMIIVSFNDALKKVDKVTDEKMGKYSNMMSGLM